MGKKEWKILIIADHFVTHQLFRRAIERELEDIQDEVTYKFLENAWPDDPLKDIEEVHEAVGNVDAIVNEVGDVDIIVTDVGPVTKGVIKAAHQLKLIAVSRGGPVNVNINAAAERRIPVVNVPNRNAQAVAEFTMGMIFSQMKKIAECHADMKKGIWRGDFYRYENAPREFPGQVVGLIGFGRVGQLLAPMLKFFGMEVMAYDPYIDPRTFEEMQVRGVEVETLLTQSDVVSLHARVTQDNVGMIGEKELRLMRPSSYLINTARGALIDHQALCRALKEGWIAGAALDIYDVEPIDLSHPLLELNNVTFTPHIAGASKETAIRAADGVAEGIAKFIKNVGHRL